MTQEKKKKLVLIFLGLLFTGVVGFILIDFFILNELGQDYEFTYPEEREEGTMGTLSAPVPLNKELTIDTINTEVVSVEKGVPSYKESKVTYKVSVTGVERGELAYMMLLAENHYNELPPGNHEWLLITLEIELIDYEENYPYELSFSSELVYPDGREVPQENIAIIDDTYGFEYLTIGETKTVTIGLHGPAGEELLYYMNGMSMDEMNYFSLPKE